MASRDPDPLRDIVYAPRAAPPSNQGHRGPHVPIEPSFVQMPSEAVAHGVDPHRGTARASAGVPQLLRQRRRKIAEVDWPASQAVLRDSGKCRHRVGSKPNAQDCNCPSGPYYKRGCELPGKDRPWLSLDGAVVANQLERIAKMKDDFGPAVGKDRLRGSGQLQRVALQRPEAADHVRKRC
jgi:hypothetical protein